jgi:hypothetical protein
MSMRSSISARFSDKVIRTIFCHFDGHISNNGKILLDSYKTQDKIEALIRLGEVVSLNSPVLEIEKVEKIEPIVCKNRDDIIEKNEQAFNYYWDGEEWRVSYWSQNKWYELEKVIELENHYS